MYQMMFPARAALVRNFTVPIGSRNQQSSVKTGSIITAPAAKGVKTAFAVDVPMNLIDVPIAAESIATVVLSDAVAAGATVVS